MTEETQVPTETPQPIDANGDLILSPESPAEIATENELSPVLGESLAINLIADLEALLSDSEKLVHDVVEKVEEYVTE